MYLEGNDLWRLGLLEDLDGDCSARHQRRTDRYGVPIRHQKNLFEFGIGPRLEGKLFNLNDVTFRDAVLLATGLYHCVCHEFVSSVGTCENPTPHLLQQAKFFPCAGVRERQPSVSLSALLGW